MIVIACNGGFAMRMAIAISIVAVPGLTTALQAFPQHIADVDIFPDTDVSNLLEVAPKDLVRLNAPVKSLRECRTFQKKTPLPDSPLSRLSKAAQNRFIASLTFNEKGTTGFSYAQLESGLSAADVHRVLALFAAQHLTHAISVGRIATETDVAIMEGNCFVGSRKFAALNSGATSGPGGYINPEGGCDDKDYACVARATNEQANFKICMTSC